MLSHEQIWAAIDRLAERYGYSASGLARRAGLDATSFNRSKRIGPDGRKRWPSTESVSKVLAATGASLDDFFRLIAAREGPIRSMVPLIGMT
ncbi:helix-turn-helix transcriptional regulator, partial [Nostoc ellipsosporum NOK]|nr:helix-turn-helix transcriptional regulator [Nostoc ellipsosporum NOK]